MAVKCEAVMPQGNPVFVNRTSSLRGFFPGQDGRESLGSGGPARGSGSRAGVPRPEKCRAVAAEGGKPAGLGQGPGRPEGHPACIVRGQIFACAASVILQLRQPLTTPVRRKPDVSFAL